MIRIEPATAELFQRAYGDLERPRVQAWFILDDDRILGVGGLAFHGPVVEVFSDTDPEIEERSPKTILRTARKVMQRVREIGRPAYAIPNPDKPSADSFLRHLGFEPGEEYYTWHS